MGRVQQRPLLFERASQVSDHHIIIMYSLPESFCFNLTAL